MKSISDNIITFDATLCITIQNEDFVLDNQNLISQLTPLLSSLYNPSTGKHILPSDITNTSFEQFLNILNHYNDTPFINSLSLSALVNVVNIAIMLKSHKIVELLTLNAKGRISLQSIIDIIIAFYPIKEKHIAIMNNVISPSIEFVIRNINAIKHEINLLPSSVVDAIAEEFDKPMQYEYDRHSKREKRTKDEIGIHAIRGGTIVGEHEIIFAGRDEIITLSHSARSKEVFAVGAVNAAVYMAGKEAGMYDMGELVK